MVGEPRWGESTLCTRHGGELGLHTDTGSKAAVLAGQIGFGKRLRENVSQAGGDCINILPGNV